MGCVFIAPASLHLVRTLLLQNDMAAVQKFFHEGGDPNVSTPLCMCGVRLANPSAPALVAVITDDTMILMLPCWPRMQVRCRMQTIALHRAAFYGHLEMCKYLLSKGCDIEVRVVSAAC